MTYAAALPQGGVRSLLALPEFRAFLASTALVVLASRALAVVIGYEVYLATRDPLALGLLGLVEAVPALTLVLYGGHFADRHDRRRTAIVARLVVVGLVGALALAAGRGAASLPLLFGVAFLAGCARAFADPAAAALEGQIVPREAAVRAGVLLGGAYQAMAVIGPAAAGLSLQFAGAPSTYAAIAILTALSVAALLLVEPKPLPPSEAAEGVIASITAGVRFVFSKQVLVGAMALDLLAVLFGGAVALLPAFATDVLKVGPAGFGLLNAAPAVGALGVMALALRWMPGRRAGFVLHAAVAGFGLSMVVFGLSESLWLSVLMLVLAGACDGVSVIVRRAILRLMSPEAMRGRVAAVSTVFIGSSNELGALESGLAAGVMGVARSVWVGGLLTLAVVALTARRAPELLALDLERAARERAA